jgi:hypothetical protein
LGGLSAEGIKAIKLNIEDNVPYGAGKDSTDVSESEMRSEFPETWLWQLEEAR